MAYDITSAMGASAKYSPGQTVGIKSEVNSKKSNTLIFEPWEVVRHVLIGSTMTTMAAAGYYYEIKSRRLTSARGNQVSAETALITWASMRTLAKASASAWVSVPTTT